MIDPLPANRPPRPGNGSLADHLVRSSRRAKAARLLRASDPASFERLRQAHAAGRELFPVSRERYEGVVLHLLGRAWRRLLGANPATTFADAVATLDRGTLLRDLAALCQGIDDPAGGAESFYRAFPGFGERIEDWYGKASAAAAELGKVDRWLFYRKCYGAALYHLLHPLRASCADTVLITATFGTDPFRVVEPINDNHWYHDLYFAVALGSGVDGAATEFGARYGSVVRAFLKRKGVRRGARDERIDDILGECVLYACNYFASGRFASWLWGQCMSYYRRWESPPSFESVSSLSTIESPSPTTSDDGEADAVYQQALERISDYERDLVVQHRLQRRTLREISERYGVDPATISRHRMKAEIRFRTELVAATRDRLGNDMTEGECREWLVARARHIDLGDLTSEFLGEQDTDHPVAEPPASAACLDVDRSEPLESCPLVPCVVP